MNWLYYLAEANLYLCVFYLAYCIFLAKETHYQLNRAYLLLSCVMAFVLPVLQIGALKPAVADNAAAVPYQITQAAQLPAQANMVIEPAASTTVLTADDYLWLVYVIGAVVLLLLLVLKLYSVFKLTRNDKAIHGKYKIIYLKDTDVAFSFFNYMFIGTRATGANTIITHELVHIRQKHSADIMFLELLKVICWFNPCIYLLQSSLKTVHEYIADEQTATTEADALAYSSFLVNNAYGAGGSSITHSFFNYNLLKKRIIMLNQQRSGKLARLKYLVALPVCAGMLCASTLAFSKSYGWVNIGPDNHVPALADTLITAKGFKYKETFYTENGHKRCSVTLFESGKAPVTFKSDPLPVPDFHLLRDKYGYSFPEGTMSYALVKLSDVKLVSPPPGSQKGTKVPTFEVKAKKTDMVKFPPKTDAKKFPPPPPPEPPNPKKRDMVKFPPAPTGILKTSSTGYQYEETGYLINKKENFRVIIHEKNGKEIDFFKNSATAADLKLLKEKYGYTFPNMEIHDKLPPPPPMAPRQ